MSLLQEVDQCLREAGYRTEGHPNRSGMILFEDYSVFGFVIVYESVKELLEQWRENQDGFLQQHAPFLRAAAQKAWNCYTVHLTDDKTTEVDSQTLFEIEENFTSTRKIARGNVTTANDIQRALFPLIPIQNLLKMQGAQEEINISQRFHDWPENALAAIFGNGSKDDLIEILMEAE